MSQPGIKNAAIRYSHLPPHSQCSAPPCLSSLETTKGNNRATATCVLSISRDTNPASSVFIHFTPPMVMPLFIHHHDTMITRDGDTRADIKGRHEHSFPDFVPSVGTAPPPHQPWYNTLPSVCHFLEGARGEKDLTSYATSSAVQGGEG